MTVKRERMSPLVRKLRRRDGSNCSRCHLVIDFTLKRTHPMAATVDHTIPRVAGGPSAMWNYTLMHGECNKEKGSGMLGAVRKRGPSELELFESWSAARN